MCLLASMSVCGYRNIVLVCFWFYLEMGSQFLWQLGLFEQWEKVSVQPAWMNFFLLHQLRQSPLGIWMLLCILWSSRRWTIRSQSISMRNTQKGTKSGPGWVRVNTCFSFIIIIIIIETHWWCQEVTVGERKLSLYHAPHIHYQPPSFQIISVKALWSLWSFGLFPFTGHWTVSPPQPPKTHWSPNSRNLSMWHYLEIGILKM